MAENSKIEWCDHTFNPWVGCTKVSTGCANCYAETLMDKRYGRVQWGPNGTRVRTSDANWRKPLKWNREAELDERIHRAVSYSPCLCTADIERSLKVDFRKAQQALDRLEARGMIVANRGNLGGYIADAPWSRPRVFCGSLCDVFEDREELEELRADLYELIEATPNLDWLLLTKRPEVMRRHIPRGFENVWLGVSVEDQSTADERIPILLDTPARVRFVSYEPALGPVDFQMIDFDGATGLCVLEKAPVGIDWVIIGGESGPGARPCNIEWIRSALRQCQEAGVACIVKQLGSNAHAVERLDVPNQWIARYGTLIKPGEQEEYRLILRDIKGGDPSEWPEDLRVRECPSGE